MRRLAQIALGLAIVVAPAMAQTGMMSAPVPGPYQIMIRPQPAPVFQQRPYSQPLPYWMQTRQQPQTQATGVTQTAPDIASRAQQQPVTQGWNASPNAQGGATNAPTPGYFPGYATSQQAGQRPQPNTQPAQNYGPAYPAPSYNNAPWGQQGFMPMAPPWGNGWGNNQNNNGYGYQQGYAVPMRPRQ